MTCSNCNTTKTNQFWHLRGYYGINGTFTQVRCVARKTSN